MNETTENRLAEIVSGKEKDLEWAKSTFDKKLADLKDRVDGDASGMEDQLSTHAVRMVKSELNTSQRTGGSVDEVNVVAIGHAGVQQWSDGDGGKKDVVISYGVVNYGDNPMGIGVFINDETTGVDLQEVMDKFQTLNKLTCYYDASGFDDLPNTYMLDSTGQTKIEVKDESEAASKEDRRNLLQQHTGEAELTNIKQHLSAMDTDTGYTVGFGADIKRLNATVVDAYVGDGFNVYTVLDDSVIDPEELDDDVRDDKSQTPGLTAWSPDDFMQYGVNSQVELYGSIETGDDGQVSMNVVGAVPLITFDLDEGGDSNSGVNVESEEV